MDTLIASVIASVITGSITLLGVILSNNSKLAVMETKLEVLTREVREHNNYAKRVPVLEEKMIVANHRIDDLERLNQ